MPTPTLSDFQYEIGAHLGRGDLAAATAAAASCRALWPDAAAGWILGSIAALLREDKQAALALVDERLRIDAGNVQCLLQKAECLLAMGERVLSFAAADSAAEHAGYGCLVTRRPSASFSSTPATTIGRALFTIARSPRLPRNPCSGPSGGTFTGY